MEGMLERYLEYWIDPYICRASKKAVMSLLLEKFNEGIGRRSCRGIAPPC